MAPPPHLVEALAATIRTDRRSVEPLRVSVERRSAKGELFAGLLIWGLKFAIGSLPDRCRRLPPKGPGVNIFVEGPA